MKVCERLSGLGTWGFVVDSVFQMFAVHIMVNRTDVFTFFRPADLGRFERSVFWKT